jgi:hypothetical protein
VIGPPSLPSRLLEGATKKGVHSVSEKKTESEGAFSPGMTQMETSRVRAPLVAIVILPKVCMRVGPKRISLSILGQPPGSKSANYGTQACLLTYN